jgi:hypothetical protein
MIEIKGHAGDSIHSLDDWAMYAMPHERRVKHWQEGRSAFELGRLWTISGQPAVPRVMAELLDSHVAIVGAAIRSGITECETRLPPSIYGPRCHDLALLAEQGNSTVTICIEAKADESFGGTVEEELKRARKRPITEFPKRIDWLTRSLLGIPAFESPEQERVINEIATLPYQLFTGVAGTLLEAEHRGSTTAVFVIHEFRTSKTDDRKMAWNASQLDGFLRLLLAHNDMESEKCLMINGGLIGPLRLVEWPSNQSRKQPHRIPLFIGKIRTDRTTESCV